MVAGLSEHMTARQVIDLLGLKPHPEGGNYRETFRDSTADANGRAASTLIYFLLAAGERSHWHRVDATEIWHYYAGAPLQLLVSEEGQIIADITLGVDLASGQRPQGVVPVNAWQSARSTGSWTLVGCTVAPGFDFAGFEMAPPGWQPG